MPPTVEEVLIIGNAVIAELTDQLSIPRIRQAVGRAGFDTARIPAEDRRASVVPAIQKLFGEMPFEQKLRVLPILAGHLSAESANKLLRPHGYQFVDGHFVPLAAADAREFRFMPPSSAEQISTAFDRLSDQRSPSWFQVSGVLLIEATDNPATRTQPAIAGRLGALPHRHYDQCATHVQC